MAMSTIYKLLTAQWVRDTYLPGIDLTDDLGTSFADQTILIGLRQAVAQLEQSLSISIDPIEIKGERFDLHAQDRNMYWPIYLHHRPLIKVDKFVLKYGRVMDQQVPNSWLSEIDYLHGRLNIMPSYEQMQTMASTLGTPYVFWQSGFAPGFFNLDYTAGFRVFEGTVTFDIGETSKVVTFATDETFSTTNYSSAFDLVNPGGSDASIVPTAYQRKTDSMSILLSRAPVAPLTVKWYVSDLPDDLRHLIGLRAAVHPLTIAGDLVLGAGVSSRSVGLDGLSQSISTTKAGAMGGAFAARIKMYKEEDERIFNAVKGRYRRMNVTAF